MKPIQLKSNEENTFFWDEIRSRVVTFRVISKLIIELNKYGRILLFIY